MTKTPTLSAQFAALAGARSDDGRQDKLLDIVNAAFLAVSVEQTVGRISKGPVKGKRNG